MKEQKILKRFYLIELKPLSDDDFDEAELDLSPSLPISSSFKTISNRNNLDEKIEKVSKLWQQILT